MLKYTCFLYYKLDYDEYTYVYLFDSFYKMELAVQRICMDFRLLYIFPITIPNGYTLSSSVREGTFPHPSHIWVINSDLSILTADMTYLIFCHLSAICIYFVNCLLAIYFFHCGFLGILIFKNSLYFKIVILLSDIHCDGFKTCPQIL